eukprot:2371447-Pleurochrysis_carterae.AAC.1
MTYGNYPRTSAFFVGPIRSITMTTTHCRGRSDQINMTTRVHLLRAALILNKIQSDFTCRCRPSLWRCRRQRPQVARLHQVLPSHARLSALRPSGGLCTSDGFVETRTLWRFCGDTHFCRVLQCKLSTENIAIRPFDGFMELRRM